MLGDEAPSGGADSIDPVDFIKRLAPDQVGLFEPISGMMLLNMDDEDFQAQAERFAQEALLPEDVRVLCAINHETYHFAQTAASGYMFDRARTAFAALNASQPPAEPPIDPDILKIVADTRAAIGDDPEGNSRLDAALEIVRQKAWVDMLNARADAGDHSLAGALIPDFFDYLEQRRSAESLANSQGLSILGVIEGSAMLAANLLTYGPEAAVAAVAEELDTLGPIYRELFAVTSAQAGERTLEIALPAAAVSLCYECPHDAYCAILPSIAAAPPGEAHTLGRALFEAPPKIEAAGAWLGDAPARRGNDESYVIYDSFHASLKEGKWGVDTYDLLADARALDRVGSFPLGCATRTRPYGPFEPAELLARLAISSLVLKARSRRRDERDADQAARQWARGVLHRLLG